MKRKIEVADSSPNMPDSANEEAQITEHNIDPAFVYSIGEKTGFLVRVTHDPITFEWLDASKDHRRFFIADGSDGHKPIYEISEIMAFTPKKHRRKTQADQLTWENWMSVHYVRPGQT